MESKFDQIRKDFFSNIGGSPSIGGTRPGVGQAPVQTEWDIANQKVADLMNRLNAAAQKVADLQKRYNDKNSDSDCRAACRRNTLPIYAQQLKEAKAAIQPLTDQLNQARDARWQIEKRTDPSAPRPMNIDNTPHSILPPDDSTTNTKRKKITDASTSTTSINKRNPSAQKSDSSSMSTGKKVLIGSAIGLTLIGLYFGIKHYKKVHAE